MKRIILIGICSVGLWAQPKYPISPSSSAVVPPNQKCDVAGGTSCTITHGLNTLNTVTECRNASGAEVAATVSAETVNSTTLAFSAFTGKCVVNGTGGVGSQGFPGIQGATGSAATLAVGAVAAGAPGSTPIVANAGTTTAAVLDFTIPQGAAGAAGAAGANGSPGTAATVGVGSVTTAAAGAPAVVTNAGTSTAATLNFTIPQGAAGAAGSNGTNGANGLDAAKCPISFSAQTTRTITASSSCSSGSGTHPFSDANIAVVCRDSSGVVEVIPYTVNSGTFAVTISPTIAFTGVCDLDGRAAVTGGGGGGASSFSALTGAPEDNAALAAVLAGNTASLAATLAANNASNAAALATKEPGNANIQSHISSTLNPHSVTKTQVGLANVPNTDATARANHTGTQTAATISDLSTAVGGMNASTATALAANPAACSAGQYVSDIAANGLLTCGTPSGSGSGDMLKTENLSGLANYTTARSNLGLGDAAVKNTGTSAGTLSAGDHAHAFSAITGTATDAQVPDSITVTLAGTATALAANGANCSAGQSAGGVNASGAAESCIDLPATYQPLDSDLTAFAGKTAPTGAVVGTTDTQTLTNKTLTSPAITTPTGIVKGDVGLGSVDNTADSAKNVATAVALAANPAACAAGSYVTDTAANGTLTCVTPASPVCVKYTVASTALTAAATTQNITLFTMPAQGKLTGITIKEGTQTTCTGGCTGITTLTVSVGRAGTETEYAPAFPLMQTVSATNMYDDGGHFSPTFASHSVVAKFTVTNSSPGNLGASGSTRLTAGSVDFWACTVTLP